MSSSELIQATVRQTLEASELGGYEPADALRDAFEGIISHLRLSEYAGLAERGERAQLLWKVLQIAEGIVDELSEDLSI